MSASTVIPERLEGLVAATADLAQRFADAGNILYLVGGVVRDAIVNRLDDADDLDFTTDALPDETEKLLSGWADAVWTQGKRFGTIGAKKGDRVYEITTHRAEAYQPRLAQARRGFRHRGRGRPGAPRLHG